MIWSILDSDRPDDVRLGVVLLESEVEAVLSTGYCKIDFDVPQLLELLTLLADRLARRDKAYGIKFKGACLRRPAPGGVGILSEALLLAEGYLPIELCPMTLEYARKDWAGPDGTVYAVRVLADENAVQQYMRKVGSYATVLRGTTDAFEAN